LIVQVSDRVTAMTGLEPIATDLDLWFSQMISIPLPDQRLHEIATSLYEDYNTVIAGGVIDEQHFMRISVQAYNTQDDIDRLCNALADLL
jgi:selenocysteine lyase/cysteine desulfurase